MKEKFIAITNLLMPICFMTTTYFNLLLWYAGLHQFDTLRTILSMGIIFLFNVCAILRLVFVFLDRPEWRKRIYMLLCIPLLWVISFLVAFAQNGLVHNVSYWCIWFCLFCTCVFCLAIVIVAENRFWEMISKCKWVSLLMIPAMVFYVMRIFFAEGGNSEVLDVGAVNYMGISYMCFTILTFAFMDLVSVQFGCARQRSWYLNIIHIVLAGTTLIFAGTRGTILCLVVFYILFGFFLLLKKIKEKRAIFSLIVSVGLLAFFVCVWSPQASGVSRITNQIKELANGVVQSAEMSSEEIDSVRQLANENDPKAQENEAENKKVDVVIDDRLVLFELAIFEGNRYAPVGLGPLGYINKYNTYPHNAVLEIYADWGPAVAIIFVVLILYLIVMLFRAGLKRVEYMVYLILLLSYLPKTLLSGTVYTSEIIMFAITFACCALFQMKKKKVSKKNG